MALVANRCEQITKELSQLQQQRAVFVTRLRQLGVQVPEGDQMDIDTADSAAVAAAGDDVDVLQAQLCVLDEQIETVRKNLQSEEEKFKRWKVLLLSVTVYTSAQGL